MRLPKFLESRRQKRRRSADQLAVFSSQIGSGLLFQGELRGAGNYLVQGEVVGNGEVEGVLAIGAGACWKGKLTADYIQIAGRFEGDIVARSKVELGPTAVVTGDLSAPLIAIAEGAVYQGNINRPRKTQVTRYRERRGLGEPKTPA
jgi:cytoskeletal protein CcmA (bactofilin family)